MDKRTNEDTNGCLLISDKVAKVWLAGWLLSMLEK